MLWSIDSCQKGYLLTSITWLYHGLKCRPVEVEYFLKLSADKLPHSNDRRLKFIFSNDSNMLCLCHYGPALLGLWFLTDLGRENSASFFESAGEAWKTFSYHGHTLGTLYVQFLCSDWSKFDRWVYAKNSCIILKIVHFDSWSWQKFVSTWDVFNCLFPQDVQNEIQLLSRVFCLFMAGLFTGFLVEKYVACRIQ